MPRFLPCAFVIIVMSSIGTGLLVTGQETPKSPSADQRKLQDTAKTDDLGKRVKQLIADLGNDDFVLRERSHQELLGIGEPALEYLKSGARAPDSEIRFRIRRLIRLIEISGYESRLAKFLSSKDPKESFGLPGWKQYANFFGASNQAREQFVSFQKRFPAAMKAIEKTSTEMEKEFKLIATTEIDTKRYTPGLRSERVMEALICNLMLASMIEQSESGRISMDSRIANWLSDNQLYGLGKQEEGPEFLKKSISIWLSQAKKFDQQTARRLTIAINLGLDAEGWRFAKLCLEPKNSSSSTFKMQAILFVRDNGDKSHIDLIKKHIDDKSRGHHIYQSGARKRVEVQIRDSALETLLKITKQKPEDYGMIKFDLSNYSSPQLLPNYGFDNDQQRKTAFEKLKSSNQPSK